MNVVMLIPSLNPNETTIRYIDELIDKGFSNIIIVNDGSKNQFNKYFDVISRRPQCIVLKHAVNLGKGRAIKTGLNYFLNNYESSDMIGVVTADADGQHSAEDTLKVAKSLEENKGSLILGTRDFDEVNVPFKSRNGNRITTFIFGLLYSKRINDTQTGLRGIPYSFIENCIKLTGERFEYEIGMLISAVRSKINIIEVKIQTIYFDSNRETHFDAIFDSLKIYSLIFRSFLKFTLTGLFSFGIDITLFALLTKIVFKSLSTEPTIFLGTFLARIVSSLFNYTTNKHVVFHNKESHQTTLLKYYFLSAVQMIASWLLVTKLFYMLKFDTTAIKIAVDLSLFFISYQVQRRWVFR